MRKFLDGKHEAQGGGHGLGSAEAAASGYGASRAMGQVGKEYSSTSATNQPFFFQARGTGRVREKVAYFRQRYWQKERVPPGGQLHQVRTVGRPWPGGEGSGLGPAQSRYFG